MSKEPKDPHKENPSMEEIRKVLESVSATKDSEVKDVYLAVHTVMLKVLPDLEKKEKTLEELLEQATALVQ